jgi:fatty acid desaturase
MAGFRERIETLARAMSFRHLLLFALLMAVLAVWNGYNSLYGTLSSFSGIIDHRGVQLLVLSASIVLGLASAYFFYLAVLKTKLAREQRNRDGAREDSAQANCLRIQNPKWTVQISVVGTSRRSLRLEASSGVRR